LTWFVWLLRAVRLRPGDSARWISNRPCRRLRRCAIVVFLLYSPDTMLMLRNHYLVQGAGEILSSSKDGAMNEETVFAAALEKASATERQAYLDEVCRGDTTLRERVEELLAADEHGRGILDRGLEAALMGVPPSEPPLASDRLFGNRFKLRQKLGEGGMGEVWVADQIEPVLRRVALKLIRPGLDSARLLARFDQERQALALMDHPNIAKVFEAGITQPKGAAGGSPGVPYFVMELIKGVSITEYCDRARLTPRQRLELFIPVCLGVQHAHQKGLIHRDLKPSNILVALYDDRPVPKVIDFGVAKVTGPRLTEHSIFTEVGALVGTLEYMSPEQAELNNLDIDTRSDIYSLGVVLYELLTGSVPFSRKELQGAAFTEMLRFIKEVDPPRPSTRLSGSGTLPSVAADRQTEPKRLIALIRGELDWIVIKCLEKERSRRYESANGLATDLQRYLANEPVVAGPPSATYRLRKFVRRNRGSLLVTGALIAILIVGGGALLAIRAEASRNRAARGARATAAAAAATATARERVAEAWLVADDPARMQQSCDAAVAELSRADESVDGEPLSDAARADITAARQDVDDLARHTRILVACTANLWQFANELNGQQVWRAEADLCTRQREAFVQFGLDPLAEPAVEAARTVAASRLREPLLGFLLEWQLHADDRGTKNRLADVIGAARRLSGGHYARWQDLLDRNDVTGLVAFATSPDGLAFSPRLVGALARDLTTARQFPACLKYLRAATDRYPHDAWLHFDLAYTCRAIEPTEPQEALRHMAAACVLRPDSALFHLQLGACYSTLGAYDLAVSSYLKSIALYPNSETAYQRMGLDLAKKKDEKGAMAAFKESLRLGPKNPKATRSYAMGLMELGRPAEALRAIVDGFGRFPSWADNPRLYLRYNAACAAMHCADGKGSPAVSPAERQTFRDRAFELLAADLAALAKLGVSDREFVHKALQLWLADGDLAGVRPPRTADLPPAERSRWEELWAQVKSVSDSTVSSKRPDSP
jgi:serine/threonine protein kinase/tetratricopeptide (TPR) repeat protein